MPELLSGNQTAEMSAGVSFSEAREIAQAAIARGDLTPAAKARRKRKVRKLCQDGSPLPVELPELRLAAKRKATMPLKNVPVFLNRLQLAQEIKVPASTVFRAFKRELIPADGWDGKGNPLVKVSRLNVIAQLLARPEIV